MSKKTPLAILKLLLIIGLFVGLQQLIELKTFGFCLSKITADDLPFQKDFETSPLSTEEEAHIQHLLSQEYRIIGVGSECFAFESADGQAVIKFFKLDHTRPVYLHRGLFLEDYSQTEVKLSDHLLTKISLPRALDYFRKRLVGIREFRLQRTFNSIKLAYEELKEETGLLYLHLNPTSHLKRSLTICDGCGIRHEIDLDTIKFFLQKKATPTQKHFSSLKLKGEHRLAEQSIDALIELILVRCKKGFSDRDIMLRNIGFIKAESIEIDSGSFRRNPKMKEDWIYKQELFYATLELKAWCKKNYPEMAKYLEDRVTEKICHNPCRANTSSLAPP